MQRRPRSGRKHLSNIARIIRAEWLDWLAKGQRKTYAVSACNRAKPIFAEVRGARNNLPTTRRVSSLSVEAGPTRPIMG